MIKEGNSNGSISFKAKFPVFKENTKLEFRFRADYLQGTFKIKNVQVELGNKKTDWKPNSSDFSNDINELTRKTSEIKITSDKINWLVASGTSSSNMQLTSDALKVIANNINLNGKVNFNSFSSSLQNKFNSIESIANASNKK